MLLDACALRSLELLSNSEGGLPGSLLHLLNGAASAAGRRKAREFISNPLFRWGLTEEARPVHARNEGLDSSGCCCTWLHMLPCRDSTGGC